MTETLETALRRNIDVMNSLEGFDIVMVCCSSGNQALYWQHRLEKGRGSVLPATATVLAVEEDWPGGAGNALGTLYAFKKASALALQRYNRDILSELRDGTISIGLYHTAGKGTRLAPLPGSENNNKPGVKLPTTIPIDGEESPITILEAVIKQTGCYAKCRHGRLSVFWGDQVFIPTASVSYPIKYHADILCSLGPMMSEEEWAEKGMEKYGLIAQCEGDKAAQVEKVSHATAVQLLSSLGRIESVGVSLGSFSVSWQLLSVLLNEFQGELDAKTGKLDSDPHLWMPMTLSRDAYLHLMGQKGVPEAKSSSHYDRIQRMLENFRNEFPDSNLGLFGPVDVGQGVYWWDYGQLKLYLKNSLMMTESTKEAEMMRLFLGLPEGNFIRHSQIENTTVDESSCISSSVIGSDSSERGFIHNSVLSNVRCKYIEADHCVLINVTADRIIAPRHSIVYNLIARKDGEENDPVTPKSSGGTYLVLQPGEVHVGVFDADGSLMVMKSNMDIDGGKHWETAVAGNPMSFEEVHEYNADACPKTLEKVISDSHLAAWRSLSSKKRSLENSDRIDD
jgi:hypothetical protein